DRMIFFRAAEQKRRACRGARQSNPASLQKITTRYEERHYLLPRLKLRRAEFCDDILRRFVDTYGCSGNAIGRQGNGEIQTLHDRSVAGPLARAVRESRRRLILVQWLAHAGDYLRKHTRAIGRAVQRADCGYRKLEWTLHFRIHGFRRIELG